MIDWTEDFSADTDGVVVVRGMPFDEYRKINAINQSRLKAFSRSMAHGIHEFKNPKAQTTAMRFGTALHTLMLDGEDVFRAKYAVGGPVNPKTGDTYGADTKAFAEWAKQQHGPYVSDAEFARLNRMRETLDAHRYAGTKVRTPQADRELTIVWTEMVHGEPIRCKARLDWVHPKVGIIDLKSTKNASIRLFGADIAKLGYHMQAAWYRRAAKRAGLITNQPYGWIAIESEEPHLIGMYTACDWDLRCGLTMALRALERYADWITGLVGVRDEDAPFEDIKLPSWAWEEEDEMNRLLEAES